MLLHTVIQYFVCVCVCVCTLLLAHIWELNKKHSHSLIQVPHCFTVSHLHTYTQWWALSVQVTQTFGIFHIRVHSLSFLSFSSSNREKDGRREQKVSGRGRDGSDVMMIQNNKDREQTLRVVEEGGRAMERGGKGKTVAHSGRWSIETGEEEEFDRWRRKWANIFIYLHQEKRYSIHVKLVADL